MFGTPLKVNKPTKRGFEAWLAEKHPRTTVGRACMSPVCPLANYVAFLNPQADAVEVDEEYIVALRGPLTEDEAFLREEKYMLDVEHTDDGLPYRERESLPSPVWVSRFVKRVDAYRNSGARISAMRALKVLATVGRRYVWRV